MKKKFTKKQIMDYYSIEDIKRMPKMSTTRVLKWLAEANAFMNKVLPKSARRLQRKMAEQGW